MNEAEKAILERIRRDGEMMNEALELYQKNACPTGADQPQGKTRRSQGVLGADPEIVAARERHRLQIEDSQALALQNEQEHADDWRSLCLSLLDTPAARSVEIDGEGFYPLGP